MKRLLNIFLIVHCSLFINHCLAQFSPQEQKSIDSLNAILSNKNSHDTARASAYVGLSEILYISNLDTLVPLCQKSITLIEKLPSSFKREKNVLITQATALNNIGYFYQEQGQIPVALDYYKKSLKIQEEIGYKEGIATSLGNIGVIYDNLGQISEGLEYHKRSLKIQEEIGNKEGMANSLSNIGFIYNAQGQIPEAIDNHRRSLNIREEIGDKKGIANSLNNLAYIYKVQGQISEALDYFKRSLRIREEIGDKSGIAGSLNNIGLIYRNQRQIPEALEYYKRSLEIQKEIGNKGGIALSLNNLGVIYNKQGQITEALDYFKRSLDIREEIGDKEGISVSLFNIGALKKDQGKIREALEYVNKSLELSKELGYPDDIRAAAKLLYQIYEKQGEGMKALEMHKLYIEMRDSINNMETQKAAIKNQMQYEYEKEQAATKAEQDKKDLLAKEEKAKQQIVLYATGGGLALVSVFLFMLFNRFKTTQRQKSIIEKQKHLVDEKQKEILDSIRYAKRIQDAILPSMSSMQQTLKNGFVLYKPKDVVAGDFYWMETTSVAEPVEAPNQKKESISGTSTGSVTDIIYFAAADCTGHGVPGAMMSVVCSNALSKALLEEKAQTTGELLDKTRTLVIDRLAKSGEDVKDGMDVSLVSLANRVESENGERKATIQWSGANNPLWIVRAKESLLEEFKPDKQPIGMFADAKPFTTHTIELQKGDTIYIFTDGYQDQFGGEKSKKFKASKLKELILSIQHEPMDTQKEILNNEFENWKGQLEQVDDVCIIGVRI